MVKKGKIKQRKKSRREGRKVREGRAREKRVYEDRKKARGKKRKEKGEPPPLNSHFWLRHWWPVIPAADYQGPRGQSTVDQHQHQQSAWAWSGSGHSHHPSHGTLACVYNGHAHRPSHYILSSRYIYIGPAVVVNYLSPRDAGALLLCRWPCPRMDSPACTGPIN